MRAGAYMAMCVLTILFGNDRASLIVNFQIAKTSCILETCAAIMHDNCEEAPS